MGNDRHIDAMNGLKNGLSFVLSAISVLTFGVAGIVAWPQALALMIAAIVGGCVGVPIARALPVKVVCGIVIVVGAAMSAIFLVRLVSHG